MFDPVTALNAPNSALFWGRQSWLDALGVVLAHSPARVQTTNDPAAVPALLAAVEEEAANGLWVAFYVSYEAGAAYELANLPPGDLVPLAWMAAYDPANTHLLPPEALPMLPAPEGLQDVQPTLNVSRETYGDALDRIHEYIACGDTYQVNYTCHARFHLDCDPLAYYLTMVRSHPVPYAAYLNLGDRQVLSISPELFLQRRGNTISSRPMKGTRKRGRTPAEDAALAKDLTTSLKDRAENLMILDMERNDLGRIARIGSVRVPHMFTSEKYRSVWQMTSTVEAELQPGVTLPDLFAATFPGASITGAPKRRTMEIIRELEPEPRGLYCGALGLHQPGTDFTCGLPIRTLVHQNGDFDLGIGAGILWDSLTGSEYEETLLKARFAFRSQADLTLFETLLLQEDGQYAYLEAHLSRLQASADYFDFPCDVAALRELLLEVGGPSSEVSGRSAPPSATGVRWHDSDEATRVGGLSSPASLPCIVRLDLTADGRHTITTRPPPPPPPTPVRVL
ncbi:MAG: aminodeoxychorismate synthase component I, partial [Armatimonadia bacterium]